MSVPLKGEKDVAGRPDGTTGDLLSRVRSASDEAAGVAAALRGFNAPADTGLAPALTEMIGKMAEAIAAASRAISGASGTGASQAAGRTGAAGIEWAAGQQSVSGEKRAGIQVVVTAPAAASGGPAARPTDGKEATRPPVATPPGQPAPSGPVPAQPGQTSQAVSAPTAGPGEAGMPPVFDRMAKLAEMVARDGLAIPDEHLAFARKAAAVWRKFCGTDKTPRVIADLVGFLDRLDGIYGALPGCEDLRALARDLIGEVAGLMPDGTELFPKPGETPDDMLASRPDLASHISLREQPSRLPKRAVLYIERRGIAVGGSILQDAVVVVSSGQPHPVRERLLDAAGKTMRGKGAREARIEATAQILKLAGEYSGTGGGLPEDVALRLALNAVDAASEGGDLDDAAAPLADRLRELGFREIRVPIGEKFDERFGPSRYERRRVPSDRPAGTIVRVIQRGFLNPDGAVVQKAIVGVSAG
ncbi:MAG: hypothetical protein N3A38_00215 [Planctomycetota bacterium]|nr:hypothetical protein [Planctomycetota bacterium]